MKKFVFLSVVFMSIVFLSTNILAANLSAEISQSIEKAKKDLESGDFDSAILEAMEAEKGCEKAGISCLETKTIIRLAYGHGAIVTLGIFVDRVREAIAGGGELELKGNQSESNMIASCYVASQVYIGQYNKYREITTYTTDSVVGTSIMVAEQGVKHFYNSALKALAAKEWEMADAELTNAFSAIRIATEIFLYGPVEVEHPKTIPAPRKVDL